MARRRFRLRIWMLMALVAVAAVAVWGWRLRRLSQDYRSRADSYEQQVQVYSKLVASSEAMVKSLRNSVDIDAHLRDEATDDKSRRYWDDAHELGKGLIKSWSQDRSKNLSSIIYYSILAKKYRRAASRPWLPVAPDPPEPSARNEPNGAMGGSGKP